MAKVLFFLLLTVAGFGLAAYAALHHEGAWRIVSKVYRIQL